MWRTSASHWFFLISNHALFFSRKLANIAKNAFVAVIFQAQKLRPRISFDKFQIEQLESRCRRQCTRRLSGQIEDWGAKVELSEIEGRHLISTRTCDATRRLLVAGPWELEYSYPKHHRISWHWCKKKWFCIEPPSHIILSGYERKKTDYVFNNIAITSNFHISPH